MNLLLVDDEWITVKNLMKSVCWARAGIDGRVCFALDAASAAEILDTTPIDVVLCDIEMPGMNGLELLRHVRSLRAGGRIAFLFLTCHAKFAYAQEALALGCSEYILKPAPAESIEAAVKNAVDRLTRERAESEVLKYGYAWIASQAESAASAPPGAKDCAKSAEAFILSHLDMETLSVPLIAKRLHLHEDYLNRVFHREKGAAIKQFIIRARMDLAARLLADPDILITAIARRTGYGNDSYFTAAFKRYHHVSPTEYRKKLIKSQNE